MKDDSTFSLSELVSANAVRYDEIEGYGRKVAIGSLNSEDMVEWLEANDAEKREAGLRILVKSAVEVVARDDQGRITEAKRIAKEDRDQYLEYFRKKDARENGKVIAACLKLNGLDRAAKLLQAIKNVSSEASPAASPTASPLPQDG